MGSSEYPTSRVRSVHCVVPSMACSAAVCPHECEAYRPSVTVASLPNIPERSSSCKYQSQMDMPSRDSRCESHYVLIPVAIWFPAVLSALRTVRPMCRRLVAR